MLTIEHNLYAEGIDGAYLKDMARGGYSALGGWQWTELFSTASAYLSDKHKWDHSNTAEPVSARIEAHLPRDPLPSIVKFSHFMTAYPVQTYRMHLTQTTLWNVCPRTS